MKALIIIESYDDDDEEELGAVAKDFEEINSDEDESVSLIKHKKEEVKSSMLKHSGEEVKRQGRQLEDTTKLGHSTVNLARSAMMALRGQRDQIVNTVGLVRDIGTDLVRSDKIARDINRR